MNPQTVLQERYPAADFWAYFHFLQSCIGTEKGNTHEHHICPRKQFPEFAEGFPENMITLKLGDHARAHNLLEAACGIKAPSTALIEATAWTPERRAQMSVSQSISHNRLEVRANLSAAAKVTQNRPEQKALISSLAKERFANPEMRARHAVATKSAWKCSEVRERQSSVMVKALSTPEARALKSELTTKQWAHWKADGKVVTSPMLGRKHTKESLHKIRDRRAVQTIRAFLASGDHGLPSAVIDKLRQLVCRAE